MNHSKLFWMMPAIVLLLFVQCTGSQTPTGFSLSGNISDAANLTAVLSTMKANNTLETIGKSTLSPEGDFEINLEQQPEPGVYRFGIGQKGTQIVVGDNENQIKIMGTLDDLAGYTYTVEGSPATKEIVDMIQQVKSRQAGLNEIKNFAVTSTNPFSGLLGAFMTTRGSAQMVGTFEASLKRVAETYGTDNNTYNYYNNYVQQLKKKSAGPVAVGDDAPEIELQGPEGETYRLSDLEGKIVLLDFWASWCRPCRRANPHVVEIYNKYKDQGFTVFSVSLDGLDQRTKNRLGADQARIDQYLEQQKQRWIKAIEDDNLSWDYHVSDLKKWDSEAAGTYGVSSIPRTFLIDREGKIAAVNPRNNLEEQLLAVLNKG